MSVTMNHVKDLSAVAEILRCTQNGKNYPNSVRESFNSHHRNENQNPDIRES